MLPILNRTELAWVKGIGEEYADLLELAGINTVPELAKRNAESLQKKLTAVNEERKGKTVRRAPSLRDVEK